MKHQALRSCAAAVLAVGTLSLFGCNASTAGSYANLRAVHASSTAPNVDIGVGTALPITNLAFGLTSAYEPVVSGTQPYSIYAAGSDSTPVLTGSATLNTNSSVTIYALGQLSHVAALAKLEDPTVDAATPTTGNAKVRVVHGSYLAGPVDVYVTATGTTLTNSIKPTLSKVTFPSVSSYLTVPAGNYEVQITATGTQSPVLITAPSVTLLSGNLYSAIAVDPTAAVGSTPSLALIVDPPVPSGYVQP